MKTYFNSYHGSLILALCLIINSFCCAAGIPTIDSSTEELQLAAENGGVTAQYLLGSRFFHGSLNVRKDYATAAEWLKKAAEAGHTRAQSILGYMYVTACGVPADVGQGMHWLRKAAERNDVLAQYYLGAFCEMGRGVEPDRFEAMDWYMKAAAQGHEESKESLTRLREPADSARQGMASDWWWQIPIDELAKKAEQGDVESQRWLGTRYKGYGGAAIDFEKARYWLEKAASKTNMAARYDLSQLYVWTTNVSLEKAFYHCSIAAAGGYSRAQHTLGEYYRDGFGTDADRGKALYWFSQAERSGDEEAAESLYALIRGSATFGTNSIVRRWVAAEDYSPPPVELRIRDLENKERAIRCLGYDPETKLVETDYTFGESKHLPLSAFHANSHTVIQNEFTYKAFKNSLRLELDKNKLDRDSIERLGKIGGRKGGTDYEYVGYTYNIALENTSDIDFQALNVECRFFYKVEELWRSMQKKQASTQKMDSYEFKVRSFQRGARYEKKTDPFVLESSYLPNGTYYKDRSAEVVESRAQGLWVRVSFTAADGCRIYRDFCDPDTLSSMVKW